MRTLQELISPDPAWNIVKEWIDLAKNKVEILPCDRRKADETLVNIQVTTRSLMGAVVYETGGLLIGNGWIRVLGSGSERLNRSLSEWNRGKTFEEYGEIPPYMLVADDAIGGFYAINGGFFGEDKGKIYYNSPDSLEWEPMGIEYSQFLLFCFETDMNQFYEGLRWDGWQSDLEKLGADHAYNFYPYLWTKEASDINSVSRKALPISEVYNLLMETKQILK